jgi:hypothetical protein
MAMEAVVVGGGDGSLGHCALAREGKGLWSSPSLDRVP